MSIERRRELIAEIENARQTRVVTYVLGDRGEARTGIAGDAVRLIYEHLLRLDSSENLPLDLFIVSNGGNIEVPWRIVSMFREIAERFGVLVPFRAMSAATLLAIGADEIVMTPKAELGPIDPSIARTDSSGNPDEVAVEDVVAYFTFLNERAGLRDQSALAGATTILAEELSPQMLGRVYRVHSHIREVAQKMLETRVDRVDDRTAATIIDTLAEQTHSHGHAIGRREAKAMGLPVAEPNARIEGLLWDLYTEYERDFELLDGIQRTEEHFLEADHVTIPTRLAAIESTSFTHEFRGSASLEAIRNPRPIQASVNLVWPPEALDDQGQPDPGAVQPIVDALQSAVDQEVSRQIRAASPIEGINFRWWGAWEEIEPGS